MPEINIIAIAVATIISIALGMLWYGPLFGKSWMSLIGMTKEKADHIKQQGMGTTYVLMIGTSFLMALVLSYVISFYGSYNVLQPSALTGVVAALWVWLGFIVPVTMSPVLWEKRPWKLWFINASYYLVSLVIMGAVLAAWM